MYENLLDHTEFSKMVERRGDSMQQPLSQNTSQNSVNIPQSIKVLETSDSSTESNYILMDKIHNVAFFGFADAKPEDPLYKEAFVTAQFFAQQGLTIVDGGGPGVMDAATKGAQSVNGETISVTFYPKDAPGFEGRYVGNIAGKEIVTRNYIERMFKLMEHADAYLIFNGGTGTISEFGTAWVMARLYFGHHKPFILYGEFWKEIISVIQKEMKMRGNETDVFRIATTPLEALEALRKFDQEMSAINHENCEICAKKRLHNLTEEQHAFMED